LPDAEPTAEVVVVGGGHNGLVCAAYLARAGIDVVVVEKNSEPGGALFWSTLGDATVDLGAVEHTAILTSGVVEELELANFGLEYVTRPNAGLHLFGDGTQIEIGATAHETAASIARIDEADADAWLRLVALSQPLMTMLAAAGVGVMPSMTMLNRLARLTLPRSCGPLLDLANGSVLDLADRWFRSPYMRAVAVSRAGFAGLPPWQAGSAAVFCFTTGGHGRRFGRPKGGSAAFVRALVSCVEAGGGRIRRDFEVNEIVRAEGGWCVRSAGGERVNASRAVVSAIPPQTTLLQLIRPESIVPSRVRDRMHEVEVLSGNISQLTLAAALDGLPPTALADDQLASTLWLMPEPDACLDTYTAAASNRLPDRLGTLLTFPSLMDPSLVPAPQATMWANSFVAARLDGDGWSEQRGRCSDLVWSTIEACIPGVRERSTDEALTTPADLERLTGALNPGNHIAPIPSQMLRDRPGRGLANRRTPIAGIYLTGAGTHPGGGVSGASGRATAVAVLDDIRPRPRTTRARQSVRALTNQLTAGGRAWKAAHHANRVPAQGTLT
jgi:beta-carotene ketolase (CrtO type)